MDEKGFCDAAHEDDLGELVENSPVEEERTVEIGERADAKIAQLSCVSGSSFRKKAGAFTVCGIAVLAAAVEGDVRPAALVQQVTAAGVDLLRGAVARVAADAEDLRFLASTEKV